MISDLENKINVFMAKTNQTSIPVDHKSDIKRVENYFSKFN